MRHTTLFLLVTLLPTPVQADEPLPPTATASCARPLHKLTAAEATRLDGRRGLFYVRTTGWAQFNGQPFCWCETLPGAYATASIGPGPGFAKTMVVEATLRVYCWSCTSPNVEYRLEDAVRR